MPLRRQPVSGGKRSAGRAASSPHALSPTSRGQGQSLARIMMQHNKLATQLNDSPASKLAVAAAAAGGDSWQRGGWWRWPLRRQPVSGGKRSASRPASVPPPPTPCHLRGWQPVGGWWGRVRVEGLGLGWEAGRGLGLKVDGSPRPEPPSLLQSPSPSTLPAASPAIGTVLAAVLAAADAGECNWGKAIVNFTSRVTNASRLFLLLRLRDPFPLPPACFPGCVFPPPPPPVGGEETEA